MTASRISYSRPVSYKVNQGEEERPVKKVSHISVAQLLVAALAITPVGVHAQAEVNGYSLRAPNGSLSIRLGAARANAGSDVFSFTQEHLTLNRGDFSGMQFATDAGFFFGDRVEAIFGVGIANRRAASNYRHLVDNDDMEIEQETRFNRVPVTLGVRYFLKPVGRYAGSYAWVPSRVAPYVAGGGGVVHYRFEQEGDFVDFETNEIFGAKMVSSSWVPTVYGAVGAQFAFTARTALATELRYDFANGPMDTQFRGFDNIDLSGTSLTAGFHVRF